MLMEPCAAQNAQVCLFAELDASTFMDNHAGTAGGAVGSTSASLPLVLRYGCAFQLGSCYSGLSRRSCITGTYLRSSLVFHGSNDRNLRVPDWCWSAPQSSWKVDMCLGTCRCQPAVSPAAHYLHVIRGSSPGCSALCSCGGHINKTLENWSTWPMPHGVTQLTFPASAP